MAKLIVLCGCKVEEACRTQIFSSTVIIALYYTVYIYTHNVRGEKNKQIYNTFTQSEEALVAFHYRAMHRPSTTTNATNAQNTQPVMFMTLEKFRACLNQTADTDCIH